MQIHISFSALYINYIRIYPNKKAGNKKLTACRMYFEQILYFVMNLG